MIYSKIAGALALLVLAPLLVFGATNLAKEEDAQIPQVVPDAIHIPIVAGDHEATLRGIEKVRGVRNYANGTLDYLKAQTLARSGDIDAAIEAMAAVERDYPEGPWHAKSRFARAELLGRLGRHEEAQAILDSQATHLRSGFRRDELAEACFEVITELTKTPDSAMGTPVPKQNLTQALQVIQEILQLDASPTVDLRALHDRAEFSVELMEWSSAEVAMQDWIRLAESVEVEPASIYAKKLALGDVLLQQGRSLEAKLLLDVLALELAKTERIKLNAQCTLLRAQTYRALWQPETSRLENQQKAIQLLRQYLANFPDQPGLSQAAFDIGEIYESLDLATDAIQGWRELLALELPKDTGPAARTELETNLRLRQRATMKIGQSLVRSGDFNGAITAFTEYTQRFPSGPDWSQAQAQIVSIQYLIASDHYAKGDFPAARAAWERFLVSYPLDALAPEAALQQAESFVQEARDVDSTFQLKASAALLTKAALSFEQVAQKNGTSDIASRSLYRLGVLQESMLGDLTAAIGTFQKCTFGVRAYDAQMRLVEILEESLSVRTKATLRSNESPTIEVTSRNLESIDIELYQLDMEAYFRRHKTHRSIENLDLDLIQADRTLTYTPEPVSPHSKMIKDVVLPIDAPGVWVATAVSGEYRATTLVLVSDLDLIIESSGTEALIFAQDMLREEAVHGASLIIHLDPAPGTSEPTVLEVETDAKGLAHVPFPHASTSLAVLGVYGPHRASEGLELSSSVAQSTAPEGAGYIYTERSTYQPGALVHWRAAVRDTNDKGAYTFVPGKEYDFTVLDHTGRLLIKEPMALSAMGTLSGNLELSPEAGYGSYTLQITDPTQDSVRHSRTFQVAEFTVPKARLTITPSAPVILLGQGLNIEVEASYSHGAAITEQTVSMAVAGENGMLMLDEQTDADGIARFTVPKIALTRSGTKRFSFNLRGQNTAFATAYVQVAGKAFDASLTTGRATYLANESFGLDLITTAADGSPSAESMTVRVLKQRTDEKGQRLQVLVERFQVQTDEQGEGRLELRLHEGGNYTLRAEGLDSLGNPVVDSLSLFISDEGDDVRLRFLNEKSLYQVGEKATLRLHNRSASKLALVIVEGKGIAESQVRPLKPGENLIEFDLESHHFPAVSVSVSLIDDHRFYRTTQTLEVERDLTVSIQPAKESVLPGKPLEVEVITTDGLGQPVAAEFSLAVVDEAYFDLYPDQSGQIERAFMGMPRKLGKLRGKSTCGFAYDGVTTRISSAVLEEESRFQLEEQAQERNEDARGFLAGLGYAEKEGAGNSGWLLDTIDTIAPASPAPMIMEIGGGAAGKFGARRGGQKSLKSSSGMNRTADRYLNSATQFWLPNGKTDAMGRVTLTVPMPSRGGTWRLHSKAIGSGTLAGQSEVTVVTKSPFLVELLCSDFVRAGDQFELLARIHQTSNLPATAHLRLNIDGVIRAEARELVVPVQPGRTKTVSLGRVNCGDKHGMLRLALEATLETSFDGQEDKESGKASALRLLQVRPLGVVLDHATSGSLNGPVVTNLALPTDNAITNAALDVYVSGGLSNDLISAAMGEATFGLGAGVPTGMRSETAGELLGALSVMEWLRRAEPEARELDAMGTRARSLVASLTATQAKEGFWEWRPMRFGVLYHPSELQRSYGPTQAGRLETTALALLALDRASQSMQVSPMTLESASQALVSMYRDLGGSDLERKAMALHALSAFGTSDFADVNRLYRERDKLSQAGLAHLVLTLVELNRMDMARELAQLLESMAIEGSSANPSMVWTINGGMTLNSTWHRDQGGMSALSLWALSRALPQSELLDFAAEGVLSLAPWRPGQTRGFALAALTSYGTEALTAQGSFKVAVTLNDGSRAVLQVPAGRIGASAHFPLADLKGSQSVPVAIDLVDSARTAKLRFAPTFTARLSGFTNPKEAYQRGGLHIPYQITSAAAPIFNGASLGVGFSCINSLGDDNSRVQPWQNLVENLPLGERCLVKVDASRSTLIDRELGPAGYLELEIPLAPGVMIVPGTLLGNIAGYRPFPGGMLITLSPSIPKTQVSFEIMATSQGSFTLPPLVLRSSNSSNRLAYSKPSRFSVLSAGVANPDRYRATPDELLNYGTALFQAGDLAGARTKLEALYSEFGEDIHNHHQAELLGMLLELAIHFENTRGTVSYFESLKQYNPELFLSLEQVLAIGRAYRDLGENERASTMFMATIAETFNRDMRVAGVLEEHGAFTPTSQMLGRLWREYPDRPSVVATRLSHADYLMRAAATAHKDENLRRAGRDRASLLVESILVLREFMALYPDHALAPDAGLNLVSAHLELEDYEQVAELAGRLAERFTEPRVRDDFRYTRAVASWFEDRPKDAKDLLLGIADAVYVDDRGAETQSINRDLSYYLLGQIHHAAGELDKATSYYGRVKLSFTEAKELFMELQATRLGLPEVTEVLPGRRVAVPLDFKGVDEVELLLYPVDLMTLYLREGDLKSVAQVNLAGIAPAFRKSYDLAPELGLGLSHIELELDSLETGAYLAMARAEGLFASGLVLVTDLALLVNEDTRLGQVRAQVTRDGSWSFVEGVDIRVVGSGDGAFQAGKTDKRGLFVSKGVVGEATVIARFGEREYAFHRGEVLHGTAPSERRKSRDKAEAPEPSFFSNVLGGNAAEQSSRGRQLRGQMKNLSQGVQLNSIP
ncbi:MAG: tetratricopeptide repeat protein [Planctomycetota bacterium]|nr:tetratricopeptide repeat protein [Planctomycetota bacterium]